MGQFAKASEVAARALTALLPPPNLTVSEWADENRVLDSSSPEPGKWRTSRTPYLREIMDCLSPRNPVDMVTFMKSAQVGGTELLLNACGFLMDHAPAPTMLVSPTVDMGKRFSKQRLAAMIENTPALRKIVKNPRARDSGNTVLMKEFRGGVLVITGANSAVGLRSLPARNVLADELDGFPLDADGEGDPLALAIKRTAAYGAKRKILAVSTPTIEGLSRIEALYKQSDQRRYYVPCPRCDYMQVLTWPNLKFPDGPENAYYQCEGCAEPIRNHEKTGMLARGEWRPTRFEPNLPRGYHINALYAPVGWISWAGLVKEFLATQKKPEMLQTFVNTSLGETWRDEAALPVDSAALHARREPYAAEVPAGGALLTCGVDVQDDRLELEVVAWGVEEESWSVAYHVLHGDPDHPDLWAELDRLLIRSYTHESGLNLNISAVCIDSGGHHSEAVYQYCWPRMPRKVWAIKGVSGFGKPIFPKKQSKGFSKAPLFLVGVDPAKERIYSRLRVTDPGPGYCHFPLAPQYNLDHFEQLTAERLITRPRNGFVERVWVKPGGTRNEALDVRVYATCALHGLYQAGVRLNEYAARLQALVRGEADTPAYTPSRSKFMTGGG